MCFGTTVESVETVGLKPLGLARLRAGRVGSKKPLNLDHEQGEILVLKKEQEFSKEVSGTALVDSISITTKQIPVCTCLCDR
jgi:hypothetical protein